jgi:protein-disulfide isomerase
LPKRRGLGMVRWMKQLAVLFVVIAAASGCERPISKLDGANKGGTAASGDVEARVRKLEENLARREEALAFLEQAYAAQKQQLEEQEASTPAPDAIFAVDVAQDIKAGLIEGPATAQVTIVKAFDFACPYCQQVNTTLEELVKDYEGKVRVVFKNYVVHPETAMPAHLASCAAAKQGKYVAFKNAFWEKGFGPYAATGGKDKSSLGVENILKIAGELQLNAARFKTDMDGQDCKGLVAADMAELEKFKVGSTPTLFVNGTHIGGALPKAAFKKLIDEKLAIVASSGVASASYYDAEIMGKGEKQFRSKKSPK